MKKLSILFLFVVLVLITGCTTEGGTTWGITGNSNITISVGDNKTDILEGVSVQELVEGLVASEDVVELDVDDSLVDYTLSGHYQVTYFIKLNSVRVYEEETWITILGTPEADNPIILGITEMDYVIGDELPDLLEGVSVTDPIFGNLTPNLVIDDSKVLYNVFGTYTITYSVSNIDGFSDVKSRTINVIGGDEITLPNDFYIVMDNFLFGIVDENDAEILPCIYDFIDYVGYGVLRLSKNMIVYYYDINEDVYYHSEYYITKFIEDDIAIARNESDFFGLIDREGNTLLSFVYTSLQESDGLLYADVDGSKGVTTIAGDIIIDIKHSVISSLSNGYFGVFGEKEIIYNSEGDILLECDDFEHTSFIVNEEEYHYFTIDDKKGVLDSDFNVVLEAKYDNIEINGMIAELELSSYEDGLFSFESETLLENLKYYDLTTDYGVMTIELGTNLYGYFEKDSLDVIIDYEYQVLLEFTDDLLIAMDDDDMYGVIDFDNTIITTFEYDNCLVHSINYRLLIQGTDQYLVDDTGIILNSVPYNHIFSLDEEGYMEVMDSDGFYGMIDTTGTEVLATEYTMLNGFIDGYLYFEDPSVGGTSNRGVYDNTFTEVLPPMYYLVELYKDGFFEVRLSQGDTTSTGFVNASNEVVVSLIYYGATPFQNGYARVETTPGIYSYVDSSGNPGPGVFENALNFDENGYAVVRIDNSTASWGVIDTNGTVVVSTIFKGVLPYSDGFFVVQKVDNSYNYRDIYDNDLVQYDFDYIYDFSGEYGKVRLGSNYYLFDKNGDNVLGPFPQLHVFDDYIFVGNSFGKYGYYDMNLTPLIEIEYTNVTTFFGGISNICSSAGECGIIGKDGEYIIPPLYSYVGGDGTVIFIESDIDSFIVYDDNGVFTKEFNSGAMKGYYLTYTSTLISLYNDENLLIETFDRTLVNDITGYKDDYFIYVKDDKYGFIEEDGNILTSPYHHITSLVSGYFLVREQNKYGVLSPLGEELIPPIYDGVSVDLEHEVFIVRIGLFESVYTLDGTELIPLKYAIIIPEEK